MPQSTQVPSAANTPTTSPSSKSYFDRLSSVSLSSHNDYHRPQQQSPVESTDPSSSGSDSVPSSSGSSFTSAGTPPPTKDSEMHPPSSQSTHLQYTPASFSPPSTRTYARSESYPQTPQIDLPPRPSSYLAPNSYGPEPPRILEPDPPLDDPSVTGRIPMPYEAFLNNRGPPPADSWLEIETLGSEYRLYAKLPGFGREDITLATKRRRILHLVADKWASPSPSSRTSTSSTDTGSSTTSTSSQGAHFERRVAFGYDADLVQVRAEFDGEMLKITIPRKLSWNNSHTGWFGNSRSSTGCGGSSSLGIGYASSGGYNGCSR